MNWNATGIPMKPLCVHRTAKRARQRQTHTRAYTNTNTQAGSVPKHTGDADSVWQAGRKCAAAVAAPVTVSCLHPLHPAHYAQSTTVNIYSPPVETLPAAKTNHFAAPAAWIIRHICLSFSQTWSVGKASKTCRQHPWFSLSLRAGSKKKKNGFVLQFLHLWEVGARVVRHLSSVC